MDLFDKHCGNDSKMQEALKVVKTIREEYNRQTDAIQTVIKNLRQTAYNRSLEFQKDQSARIAENKRIIGELIKLRKEVEFNNLPASYFLTARYQNVDTAAEKPLAVLPPIGAGEDGDEEE